MEKRLPTFRNPPVDETVVGVQFTPLPISVPHFGLFWETVRERYPTSQTHIPIVTRPELQPDISSIEIVQEPNFVRCWFEEDTRNFLIQLQRDRFLTNWRRLESSDIYPRYEPAIRPRFVRELENFYLFADAQLKTPVSPTLVEVTYINNIDDGRGWESIKTLHRYFPSWNPPASEFLPPVSMASIRFNYEMSTAGAKLSVALQPVMRATDADSKFLQLKLTATHPLAEASMEDVFVAADRCREWIVRAFAELTGPELHTIWGREED